ncbi:MAG: ABC transporter permease [Euryarchaeota archaeon]|nr:ABC transporter permease [Euryarchaeota archaeon]
MTKRITTIFTGLARQFFRSPGSVFWTVAFPVILILIFGAIFDSGGFSSYDLYLQDLDGSDSSRDFIQKLRDTEVLNIHTVPADEDIDSFITSRSIENMLIIPAGFEKDLQSHTAGINLSLRQDGTSGTSMAVFTTINAVVQGYNLKLAGGENYILVTQHDIISEDLSYIDFFLPGIIGLMIMMIAVQSTVGYQTRFRNHGIFRKLATTPLTNAEWLIGMMLWMLVMVGISVATVMITGILVFNVTMSLDVTSLMIIIISTGLFTAIGIIISQFVKDEEVAGTAAGAVTFPMMFLAGSFFPLESMPGYLQSFAKVLPLTYVNNGLRDAMIYGNTVGALDNMLIIIVIALVVIITAVAISGWKKE